VYSQCLEAERRAWQEAATEEDRRDGLGKNSTFINTIYKPADKNIVQFQYSFAISNARLHVVMQFGY